MDNQRLILFIALSFVLVLLWEAWQQDYGQQPSATGAAPEETAAEETPLPDLPEVPEPAAPAQTAADLAPGVLKSGERIRVVTDNFNVEIDTMGGDLRQVQLHRYPVALDSPDQPFELLGDQPPLLFVAQSGLRAAAGAEPTHHSVLTPESTEYRLADDARELRVPLHWRSPDGVEATKTYTFTRNSFVIGVEYRVRNTAATEWRGRPYRQLQRQHSSSSSDSRFIRTYTGGVLYSPEEKYEKISFKDMEEQDLARTVTGGWAAMIQHYFLAAWVPPLEETAHYYTKALSGNRFVIGMVGPEVVIAPGSEKVISSELFVGPKLQDKLRELAPGLELTVDYGVLTVLAKPLFWALTKIHVLIGNWGWAIAILTLLIKLAFFKLSETSYRSMANMRKLAPRMQALKERYGDDRQKLNQAMMDLYKKEKINPLGGCLPILVQIPVFIALYWVLLESVELRQAPFMLWIKDLSAPDPFYVLPLIMGATMLIQQKLNPAPMDPIQAKVMMILPVVFTIFFAFFPAGLVLYWVVNNTLSIAQQWAITRRVEKV